MTYIKASFIVSESLADILIAELDNMGYEGIVYEEKGFYASIDKKHFKEHDIISLVEKYLSMGEIHYTVEEIIPKNWNAVWEKSFQPVEVEGKCYIRAGFHPPKGLAYDIVIDPKMAFGTGHHATTYMMVQHQLHIDHKGKRVLDAGCGTGILSIMAEKRRAKAVHAYDFDPLSYENTIENVQINNCKHIQVFEGTITSLQKELKPPYDLVLANINKKVLLEEIPLYVRLLNKNGKLLVSGFYEKDKGQVVDVALKSYLRKLSKTSNNSWASILFEKNQ